MPKSQRGLAAGEAVDALWNWSLDTLAQHEPMLPWKAAFVVATSQNQVAGLRDDDQFFVLLHRGLRCFRQQKAESQTASMTDRDFQSSTRLRRVGVKQ